MNNQINIQTNNVLNAYKNASNEQKELLENLFGKDMFKPKDIRERVKTFEDACEVLGISPVLNCHNLCICEKHEETSEMHEHFSFRQPLDEHAIAYLKLCVIAEALNEGWKPVFDGESSRYYPWFYIYTKKEYEELDDDEKAECRVVGRSYNNSYASGGLVCASAYNASSNSNASYGSRLAFKTRELAEYCGKQFIDIWEKFLFA